MQKVKLVLETSGLKYKSQGESIEEALGSLGLEWNNIKAKGVVKVSTGKNSYEHLFTMNQLRRIFANKLTRMMWGKRLAILLDGKHL